MKPDRHVRGTPANNYDPIVTAVVGSGPFQQLVRGKMNANTPLNQIPPPTGPVNFNQQQAISFVLENRTSDPASPATGQIWLRTDL